MTRFIATFRVIGIFLMIFSLSMLPPICVELYYRDGALLSFVVSFALTLITGFLLWFPFRNGYRELKIRDGFLVVVLFWSVLSLFGALPLYFNLFPKLSFTDAYFESVSGLTTTGASVLSHLRTLPHAILYYRQQLHLLGGIGIIVLAVAVLPMLGIGGMQLYRAEVVGPLKTSKLRPRIAQTAKSLWYIYVGLVVLCTLAFWAAGMHLFDAIGESFSTLSTGGFATHDTSFAYYHSAVIDGIAIIFMLLGATNFGLHYQFLKYRKLSIYNLDPEFRAYLKLLLVAVAVVAITLFIYHDFHRGRTLLNAIFTVVSISTTTGFTTVNFSMWPSFLPVFLMIIALIGGSGGSTAGGLKIMRVLMLKQQGKREMARLVHPAAVIAVKLGDEAVSDELMQSIWAFVAVFFLVYIVLLLGLLATGLNFVTAFGALSSCISNTGAAIGEASKGFATLPMMSKWILSVSMLAGRLEIFTILVLLTPDYWRR